MQKQDEIIYCRWAPSLGSLEATHQEVWGTREYKWWKHRNEPTVFFGLYDLRDYLALWAHKGKAWVLWAGSDIRNLGQGFFFNDGKLRILSRMFKFTFINWILKVLRKAEHWVENDKERDDLAQCGVWVTGVCPSFLGKIEDFKMEYWPLQTLHAYVSSGRDRQEEYGFGVIERIAGDLPDVVFHLFGADWKTRRENVIVHGRVPKSRMNEQIKHYQLGLRLNESDGFSEIMAKAVLMGQYAIGKVKHPKIPSYTNDMDLITKINKIRHLNTPNTEAALWYRENLNKFPWCNKK